MVNFEAIHRKLVENLWHLENRQAKYSIDAPVSLINEIDDYRKAIKSTEAAQAGEISEADWYKGLQDLIIDLAAINKAIKADSQNVLTMPADRPSGRQLVALKNQNRQWVQRFALAGARYAHRDFRHGHRPFTIASQPQLG